jgi:recombination protein RecT
VPEVKPKTRAELVRAGQDFVGRYRQQFLEAAPRALQKNPERLLRILYNAIAKEPKLASCTPVSLIGSMLEAVSLGLEVGVAGQAWILPYKDTATLIIGYRGLAALAWRSDKVTYLNATAVRAGDDFEVRDGTDSRILHVRKPEAEYGDIVACYAQLDIVNSRRPMHDWMTAEDIERVRKRSPARNAGPWVTDYEEMAKKTVLRRLLKISPVSIEVGRAVDIDEAGEREDQVPYFDVQAMRLPAEPITEASEAPSSELLDQAQKRIEKRRPANPESRERPKAPAGKGCEVPGCNEPAVGVWGDGKVAACAEHGPDFEAEDDRAAELF